MLNTLTLFRKISSGLDISGANIHYASDYFQQLWDLAVELIKQGKAYIDEQSAETIAKQKARPQFPVPKVVPQPTCGGKPCVFL